jgi:hypothetical protein
MGFHPFTPLEILLFSAVRIDVVTNSGESGVGTGFFFMDTRQKDNTLDIVVTNKHVIEGHSAGLLTLHAFNLGNPPPNDSHVEVFIDNNFEQSWIHHPDPNVDLCAMPAKEITDQLPGGRGQFHASISSDNIISDELLLTCDVVEDVLMIGYPIGLWDDVNSLPIVRRGITASHPGVNYRGRSETVIDIATFQGSSGSPVFIPARKETNKPGAADGPKDVFLGVLHGGPFWEVEGRIVDKPVPIQRQEVSISPIMIHLGYVIKAKEVLVLADEMRKAGQGKRWEQQRFGLPHKEVIRVAREALFRAFPDASEATGSPLDLFGNA